MGWGRWADAVESNNPFANLSQGALIDALPLSNVQSRHIQILACSASPNHAVVEYTVAAM